MTMLQKSPFESQEATRFRQQLAQAGRDIAHVLDAHGIEGDEAAALKIVANGLTKSGIQRRGKGETILERVTNGMHVSALHRFLGNDDSTVRANERNRAIMIGYCDRFENFDAAAMANGKPQSDAFLREAAHELEALERISTLIDVPYEHLAHTEDDFHEKVRIFREFENQEIGHYYDWQKVEDPFGSDGVTQDADRDEAPEPVS